MECTSVKTWCKNHFPSPWSGIWVFLRPGLNLPPIISLLEGALYSCRDINEGRSSLEGLVNLLFNNTSLACPHPCCLSCHSHEFPFHVSLPQRFFISFESWTQLKMCWRPWTSSYKSAQKCSQTTSEPFYNPWSWLVFLWTLD